MRKISEIYSNDSTIDNNLFIKCKIYKSDFFDDDNQVLTEVKDLIKKIKNAHIKDNICFEITVIPNEKLIQKNLLLGFLMNSLYHIATVYGNKINCISCFYNFVNLLTGYDGDQSITNIGVKFACSEDYEDCVFIGSVIVRTLYLFILNVNILDNEIKKSYYYYFDKICENNVIDKIFSQNEYDLIIKLLY